MAHLRARCRGRRRSRRGRAFSRTELLQRHLLLGLGHGLRRTVRPSRHGLCALPRSYVRRDVLGALGTCTLRGWSQIMTSFGDTHGLLWKHDERRKLVLDVSLGRPSQGQLQRAALDQLRLNLRVHLEGRGNGPRLSGCCGGEDLSLLGGRARVDLPHRDGGWATSGTRCRAGRERRLILARGRAARMTT